MVTTEVVDRMTEIRPRSPRRCSVTTDIDVCEPYHGGVLESEQANASVAPSKAHMRNRIVQWLNSVGTGTCDEAEVALDMRHQTCSARFAELRQDGLIQVTGMKRLTRSGCSARVFRCATEGKC